MQFGADLFESAKKTVELLAQVESRPSLALPRVLGLHVLIVSAPTARSRAEGVER